MGIGLMLLSLLILFFSCYYLLRVIDAAIKNLSPPTKGLVNRDHIIIIVGLAAFILCFILCAFLVNNNSFSAQVCTQDDSFISYQL